MSDIFSYDTSWDNLEKVFSSGSAPAEKWTAIIDFHAALKPKSFWTELKQIDTSLDIKELKEWLLKVFSDSPPPKNVVALWFGITKLLIEDEKEVYAVYLTGSDDYEKEDIEWATEPTYLPADRYFGPDGLNQLDKITQSDEDYSFLDWILPVAYMSVVLDKVLEDLVVVQKLKASCGHDSGDYMNLRE